VTEPTATPALRDTIAEALMSWTECHADPKYAAFRRSEVVCKNAYGRADAVLSVLPPLMKLTNAERQFLQFALDLAFNEMVSKDGFTKEDHDALEMFQKLAKGEAR